MACSRMNINEVCGTHFTCAPKTRSIPGLSACFLNAHVKGKLAHCSIHETLFLRILWTKWHLQKYKHKYVDCGGQTKQLTRAVCEYKNANYPPSGNSQNMYLLNNLLNIYLAKLELRTPDHIKGNAHVSRYNCSGGEDCHMLLCLLGVHQRLNLICFDVCSDCMLHSNFVTDLNIIGFCWHNPCPHNRILMPSFTDEGSCKLPKCLIVWTLWLVSTKFNYVQLAH